MAIILEITVIPLSGKEGFFLTEHGELKCYLKSAPEKGKANTELVRLLSLKIGIPQLHISILSGATGRKKRVKIEGEPDKNEIIKKLVK